jgi:hypothetical protein
VDATAWVNPKVSAPDLPASIDLTAFSPSALNRKGASAKKTHLLGLIRMKSDGSVDAFAQTVEPV